jgi:pimeloyl-ACP methyl ester carboxylesterase
MKQEVFELHALLRVAKVPGPYVLVGHSIGGLLIRRYTEQYGSEVIGIVLAAATHESARLGVNPETLGDRPLIVLAPTRRDSPPPGTSEDLWNELRLEKGDQAMGLVLLSKNSKLVRDPSSGHNIQIDNPQLVARAIDEVAQAAVKGTQLSP